MLSLPKMFGDGKVVHHYRYFEVNRYCALQLAFLRDGAVIYIGFLIYAIPKEHHLACFSVHLRMCYSGKI